MSDETGRSVTLKGNPVTLAGSEIKPGDEAPDFTAVDTGLQPVRLSDAKGKVVILSSVPSIDTAVCDAETRKFNEQAAGLDSNIEVWTVSMDLPFAQKRWCGAAGIDRVKVVSDFRERQFGENYGVRINDGPLAGVLARAVFVVDRDGNVKYVEYVKEIASEPDYQAAIGAAIKAAQG
jgi:thioredoxin-dependent peroxiredoxin